MEEWNRWYRVLRADSTLLDKTALFCRRFHSKETLELEKGNTGLGGLKSIFCNHYKGSDQFLKSNSAILTNKNQHNMRHLGIYRRSPHGRMYLLRCGPSSIIEWNTPSRLTWDALHCNVSEIMPEKRKEMTCNLKRKEILIYHWGCP